MLAVGRRKATAAGLDHRVAIVEGNAEALPFGMHLNRVGNIAQMVAGLGLFDADHQALIGHIDQPPRLQRHIADEVHAAGIAVPAIEQRRHVDVHDIAVTQHARIRRDAVAHHVVDRDAARMGIAAIAERCRHGPAIQRHLADQIIKILG